ncbi:MAG: phasin family protein [Methylocella sp.]
MQAIASEIFEISKRSFELTTQTLEKLGKAHGADEIAAIQTDFMKEAFEHSAQHARKFSELIAAFPAEITKSYQEAWLKSVNAAMKATEKAN